MIAVSRQKIVIKRCNHQTDGRCQSTQRHQIEALAHGSQADIRDSDGYRNNEARDQRRGPVAQEKEQNDAREHESDEDGVHTSCDWS
jgi:hypothetical protein